MILVARLESYLMTGLEELDIHQVFCISRPLTAHVLPAARDLMYIDIVLYPVMQHDSSVAASHHHRPVEVEWISRFLRDSRVLCPLIFAG